MSDQKPTHRGSRKEVSSKESPVLEGTLDLEPKELNHEDLAVATQLKDIELLKSTMSSLQEEHRKISVVFENFFGQIKSQTDKIAPLKKQFENFENSFPDRVAQLISSSAELNRLSSVVSEKENLINQIRKELEDKTAELNARKKELDETSCDLQKCKRTINALEEEKVMLEKFRDRVRTWLTNVIGIDSLAGGIEKINESLGSVDEKLSQLRNSLQIAKNERDNAQENLSSEMNKNGEKISVLQQELEDKEKKLQATMASVSEEKEKLRQEMENKTFELQKNFDGRIAELQVKLKKANSSLQQTVDQLDCTRKDLEKACSSLEEKTYVINSLNLEIESAKKNESLLTTSLSKVKNEMSELERVMAPYMEILEAVRKCPSMKSAVVDVLGLPENGNLSIENQIVFVNKFADKFTFARIIYDAMKFYKEAKPEKMTEEELVVIDLLNTFYRKRYSINFDAMDCAISQGNRFDRKRMKLITDPNNTDVIEVSFLCVPALFMMNGKDFEQKALIIGE